MPTSAAQPQVEASTRYPFRYECVAQINATVADAFRFLDDPKSLTGHMSESSWQMGGGSMQTDLDDARGQAIGSKITLRGNALGVKLLVSEVVTERVPPYRKAWETVGTPRILVIGSYRMGFDLTAAGNSSTVRVFIEYAWPKAGFGRLLGRLFGNFYAKWCTGQVAHDAQRHFQHAT